LKVLHYAEAIRFHGLELHQCLANSSVTRNSFIEASSPRSVAALGVTLTSPTAVSRRESPVGKRQYLLLRHLPPDYWDWDAMHYFIINAGAD